MFELLVYLIILVAYLPGLFLIKNRNGLQRAPLLFFAFIGMFFFNALGSIMVMTRHYNYFGPLLTSQYVSMLILQALIFYAVAVPYLNWKQHNQARMLPQVCPKGCNTIFIIFLGCLVVFILALYLRDAGGFLIVDLMNGKLNSNTVLEYRANTYGLTNFRFYRLGFLVLPAMICAHLVLISMGEKRLSLVRAVGMVACLVPPLLMAEKAGVLYLILVVFAAFVIGGRSGFENVKIRTRWPLLLLMTFAVLPTLLIYFMYYAGSENDLNRVFHLMLFRTFGSYTESIAASVTFAQEAGWLHGLSFPNVGGLLPWERVNIEAALHHYMTHWTVTFQFLGLVGSSSLPAVAEGYINFGWLGFIGTALIWFFILIIFQEILDRLRPQPVAEILTAWYAYLAFFTSLTSLFATLVSFIHTAVAFAVYLLYLTIWISCAAYQKTR
jgi:oligosaccharide repeat unit polymerase